MSYWQPQSQTYGGALETVHLTDYGMAHLAHQAEGAARVGEFNQPFRDYISLGTYGSTDHPANVQSIQNRVAALEYNLANGGSLTGIVGADHGQYIGSLAIAGRQFSAPDYSNAPDPLTGGGFSPVEFNFADLASPSWTNAYSDLPGASSLPGGGSGAASVLTAAETFHLSPSRTPIAPLISLGTTLELAEGQAISSPEIGVGHHELSRGHTAEKTVFLGESATVETHLNLSPDVQEKLHGIASTFKSYDLSGGAVGTSQNGVTMQSLPNLAPKAWRELTPNFS